MKTRFSLALALCLFSLLMNGQEITGRWRSSDNTRIYHIYPKGNELEAILEKSTRKSDKQGMVILSSVKRKRKGRYKGIIRAVNDDMTTIAVMKLKGKNKEILKLRLRRFGIGVTIRWYRQL